MLYGEINRQRLKIINEHVVADTIDYLEAQFSFSEDWDGLEKWVHFAKDGEVYDIRLTDDCIRKEDHLNLSAGIWKVYLHGNDFSGGKVIERITTNATILKVEPTGALNGEPFPEMPASVTEQILARLDEVEQNGGGTGGTVTSVAGVEPDESGDVPLTPADIGAAEVEITDEEVNVVTVSGTASVGQTIVVEQIDEQGRPVMWRAADLPEPGNQSAGSDVWYGTTSTNATTAEKEVTTATGDFKLTRGAVVAVKFLTNSVNCGSLIVDGTAKTQIRSSYDEVVNDDGSDTSSADSPTLWHNKGEVIWFVYDGKYFIVTNGKSAGEKTVGLVNLSTIRTQAAKNHYTKTEIDNKLTALDTAIANAIGSGVVS